MPERPTPQLARDGNRRFDPGTCASLLGAHAALLGVLWTGVSAFAVWVAAALFVVRAFGLTAGYHRYFAHRAFRTGRGFQFALAWLGASAAQLGPLWWAAHHRRHHLHSDTEIDLHSPTVSGFWWAHMGWLLCPRYSASDLAILPDFARFPELRWLDRYHFAAPAALIAALYALGAALERYAPGLGTSGAQLVVVGFFASTVVLYHVTFAVNSLGHLVGDQPFETGEHSRNNFWLALITLGDGWHNNHHRFPAAARHGLRWWEFDATYTALRGLAALGWVWDLRPMPPGALRERRSRNGAATMTARGKAERSPTRA